MKLTPALTPAFRKRIREPLHVVTAVSNFARFSSRYRIFRDWARYMKSVPGVKLYVVETALGDAPHEVTSWWNPRHLQLRTNQELWYKEAMINAGVKHLLPTDWKYMAWIDGDVWFHRRDWAEATLHALQRHPVVQPWSECVDLGPRGNALNMVQSFCSLQSGVSDDPRVKAVKALRDLFQGQRTAGGESTQGPIGHTGFAWACTRRFFDGVIGLMEFPILGTADCHMAWSLVGRVSQSYPEEVSEKFKQGCLTWERWATRVTGGHVGYVPGLVMHAFHGPKARRRYDERWGILLRHGFDPSTDISYTKESGGWSDLFRIKGKPELLEEVKAYFSGRDEDSTEEFV